MKTFTYKKAFTLIELLIVVVIIGVLASIVIPRYSGQQEKARVAEAITTLSAMRKGQLAYFDEHGGAYLQFANQGNDASFESLGMARPVRNGHYWTYGAGTQLPPNSAVVPGAQPGMVFAVRRNVPPGTPDATNVVGLNPDGTWVGNGNYAPGSVYAPKN